MDGLQQSTGCMEAIFVLLNKLYLFGHINIMAKAAAATVKRVG